MDKNQSEFISLECPRCGAPLQMGGDILTCLYCRARVILKRTVDKQRHIPTAQDTANASGFSLNPCAYYDPQANLEAFSLLVPQGWQTSGGVEWIIERPAAPAQIGLKLINPDGYEAFEVFPNLHFTWTSNALILMTKPPGSKYFGFEVRKPVPAREAMRQYVLPRYRKVAGLAVVEEGPALELLQAIHPNQPGQARGGGFSADSARVRLHYMLGNQPVAEEMSCITEYTRLGAGGMFGGSGSLIWNISYLTSFRALPQRLESYADLYRMIFSSFKFNPNWTSLVQQVIQGLSSNTIHHIQQIGEISRQINRNAGEMRQQNLQGWQERSAVYDRVAEKASQTIREVDPYYDPNTGKNVELPSGYTQAWSTPLGEYILTDDPNFNPNIGSSQTWTPLAPPKE